MRDILTVTLNPALDLSTAAERVRPGPKLRCDAPLAEPGGGGINVARVAAALGAPVRAFVALGGATGEAVAAALADTGLALARMRAPGETRQNLTVTERTSGAQYRFVMPGPAWSASDGQDALHALASAAPSGGIAVLSGSLPPGLDPGFAADICAALAEGGAEVIADLSGEALARVAAGTGGPSVLRMDLDEAETLVGRPLPAPEDAANVAAELARRGAAARVVVSCGAVGSVMAEAGRLWFSPAAQVEVVSKVGAGDSLVGAFAAALAAGRPAQDALEWGVAAASAAVTTPGTALCAPDLAAALREHCAARAF